MQLKASLKEFIQKEGVYLYFFPDLPYLAYHMQFWVPHIRKVIEKLKSEKNEQDSGGVLKLSYK